MKPPAETPQPATQEWVAILITLSLVAIAAHQQLTAGRVSDVIVGALVMLAFSWAGRSVEAVDKWLRR